MSAEVAGIVVTAVVSVATTLLAVFYAPAWKARVDVRNARRLRSDELLSRYSEPLARAAFDLQSRLYNLCQQRFLTARRISPEYRRLSTLWLFGQFLGWVEILRREVQVLDFGDLRRTAGLQQHLLDVADIVSSDTVPDASLRVFRAEQRAIGELMVVERHIGDQTRTDCMGYAEFVHRCEEDGAFMKWLGSLDGDVTALMGGRAVGIRPVLIQRALIDLLDFLDADRIRFPDLNERGKIPLPAGEPDRKRLRPPGEIARFWYVEGDPYAVVAEWAREHKLTTGHAGSADVLARLRGRVARRRRIEIRTSVDAPWVEIYVAALGDPTGSGAKAVGDSTTSKPDRDGRSENRMPRLTSTELAVVNDLLRRFDRPLLRR